MRSSQLDNYFYLCGMGNEKQSATTLIHCFDAGVKVSSHCDFPANGTCPQDPFGIIEIAVTGQMINPYTGAVYPAFEPEELCTLDQALQALTLNGAWQLGLDN